MMNSNSLHNMARKYHRRLMLFGGLVTAILVTACLLMLLVLGACTNEALVSDAGTEIETDTDALRFDISIAPAEELENTAEEPGTTRSRTCVTRAVTDAAFRTTFEDGDAIGIFAVDQANLDFTKPDYADLVHPIHNAKLTYDAATDTWQGNIYWPKGFTGYLHFFAYYPYDDCGGHPERMNLVDYIFRAATDQNATATAATGGRDPYSLSDLMGAYDGARSKADPVSLTFHHLMAMVQVSVPAGPKGSGPDETLAVRLNGVQTEAKVNFGCLMDSRLLPRAAPANTQADPVTLILRRVEQPGDADYATTYTYRALLPAQIIPPSVGLIRMDYGPWMFTDAPMTEKLELYGGSVETFTRALPAKVISTVHIPAGTFLMGSSDGSNIDDGNGSGLNTTTKEPGRSGETQHRVTLSRDFWMSKYQITNAQYAEFLNAAGIGEDGKWSGGAYPDHALFSYPISGLIYNGGQWKSISGKDSFPVVNVTWYGAAEYARWVGGSLPTEAQWEYACRGGQTESLPFGVGDGKSLYADMANFNGEHPYELPGGHISNYTGTRPTTYLGYVCAVGSYAPNGYGLYDMHGNAWEWCSDWHDDYGTLPVTDPTGPDQGSYRVLRGGSWGDVASMCRSASRYYGNPVSAASNFGFRVIFPEK